MMIHSAFKRASLYPAYLGVPDCFNVTVHGRLKDSPTGCLTEKIVYTSLFECAEVVLSASRAIELQPYSRIKAFRRDAIANNLIPTQNIQVATKMHATKHFTKSQSPHSSSRSKFTTNELGASTRYVAKQSHTSIPSITSQSLRQSQWWLTKPELRKQAKVRITSSVRSGVRFRPRMCGPRGPCCLILAPDEHFTRECYRLNCLRNSKC